MRPPRFIHLKISFCFNCLGSILGELSIAIPEPIDAVKIEGFVFKELIGKEVKLRFRPHFFSYTEPSLEIDFSSPLVRKMGKEWLEIAGCGMVHPAVFETVGYDPEAWSGWAFGFGIERIAMIRYGISDIRLFYENDKRFLDQFWGLAKEADQGKEKITNTWMRLIGVS